MAHCMLLLGLLPIFGTLFWRTHVYIPLAILEFDHIFSCGALYLVGTLHIHPLSWLPCDSHM
jgi:hypothetical protein